MRTTACSGGVGASRGISVTPRPLATSADSAAQSAARCAMSGTKPAAEHAIMTS